MRLDGRELIERHVARAVRGHPSRLGHVRSVFLKHNRCLATPINRCIPAFKSLWMMGTRVGQKETVYRGGTNVSRRYRHSARVRQNQICYTNTKGI